MFNMLRTEQAEARLWDEVVRWGPHKPPADKGPSGLLPAVVLQ